MRAGSAVVQVKGSGDLGTGVALQFFLAGFPVVCTEVERPYAVRLGAALAAAVFEGDCEVEGVRAVRRRPGDALAADFLARRIPVVVHPGPGPLDDPAPVVLVDAVMAKRNTGTKKGQAPIVIALGPGFLAGEDGDVDAIVETCRGPGLGGVVYRGRALPDTGVPGDVGGETARRVLRAHAAGRFARRARIGDRVVEGEAVAEIVPLDGGAPVPVRTTLAGVLRGLLHDGLDVERGTKVGDVDPRAVREHCFTVSDKSRAVGGGALAAALRLLAERGIEAPEVAGGRG